MNNLAARPVGQSPPGTIAEHSRDSARKILVVDDEPNMVFGFTMNLEREGYHVMAAESGKAALELHASFRPEVILLDLKLPDIHGLEVLRRIRASDPDTRVIIVSCLGEPEDRAAGLSAGANDYQIKPFAVLELLGRVRTQLEFADLDRARSRQLNPNLLVLDPVNRIVYFRSHVTELSAKPFALLKRLVEAGGDCVTKAELLREVWHFRDLPDTHTIEQQIANLRQLLRTDPDALAVIITVYGLGYRINPIVLQGS
jgi:DNA-binding response OmpR family regulator